MMEFNIGDKLIMVYEYLDDFTYVSYGTIYTVKKVYNRQFPAVSFINDLGDVTCWQITVGNKPTMIKFYDCKILRAMYGISDEISNDGIT